MNTLTNSIKRPVRQMRNWGAAMLVECDACGQYRMTVPDETHGNICASCCDAVYTAELESFADAAEAQLAELRDRESRVIILAKNSGELFDTIADRMEAAEKELAELREQAEQSEPPEHLLPKGNSRDVAWRRGAFIDGWRARHAPPAGLKLVAFQARRVGEADWHYLFSPDHADDLKARKRTGHTWEFNPLYARAAMLQYQPQNQHQNIPENIPGGLVEAVNNLLNNDGSRGCYHAMECGAAREKIELWLSQRQRWEEQRKVNLSAANSPVVPDVSVPKGYALVPSTIYLDESDIESICSQCGDGGGNYGDFTRGILWVGNIQDDEGNITHGLHISSDDYPDEGGITLAKFAAAPQHKDGDA